MMDKKIILFEIDKYNLPDLSWTQDPTPGNEYKWTASLIDEPYELYDSNLNSYRKLEGSENIDQIILRIKIRDSEFDVYLAETDITPELVVSAINSQLPGYLDWTASVVDNSIVFTSTQIGGGPVSGFSSTFSRESNVESSISLTRQGIKSTTLAKEVLSFQFPHPTNTWKDFWRETLEPWLQWIGYYQYPRWDLNRTYNGPESVFGQSIVCSFDSTYSTGNYRMSPESYGTYRCKLAHTSTDINKPGVGANWRTYWERVQGNTYPYTPYSDDWINCNFNLILRDNSVSVPLINWSGSPFYNVVYYVFSGLNDSGYFKNQFFQHLNPSIPTFVSDSKNVGLGWTIERVGDEYTAYYAKTDGEGYWKNEGVLAWQASTTLPITTDPIVVEVEGSDGSVDAVYEQQTLTIHSASDSARSFKWNNGTLIIRSPADINPNTLDWNSSIKKGYSNFEGWYNVPNPRFYEGRLTSIPDISYQKDSTYYSIVSFDGGSIILNNTDGFFDNLDDEDVYGQICTLKYSSDSGASFQTIYTGYFESYQLNGIPGECIVNVYDKRKVFSNSLPKNYYSITTYPYLNTSNDGLPIALGFGKINKATAICLNETEQVSVDPIVLPDYFTFKVCDSIYPIQSIDTVYFEGEEVEPVNVDLTNCTFQLPSTVYIPGKFVSVSYHGYVVDSVCVENPITILEIILERWAGIAKNSFNYNIEEWNSVRDKVDLPNIGIHIAETKTMIDVIGEISNSVFGTFLIQKDGLITFKIRDITKDPVATITVDDQVLAPVQNYKSEEYANSIRVGHSKAWSNGKLSWITVNDQEESLFDRYRINSGKEVATLLSSKTDAQTYGNSLYLQYAGIFPTFTITTKNQFLNLDLEDLIDVEVYILPDGSYGKVRLEVLGVNADLNNNIITITGRFVSNQFTSDKKKLIKFVRN